MPLGEEHFTDDDSDSSTSDSSSSSSSTSDNSSRADKHENRSSKSQYMDEICPHRIVRTGDDGELEVVRYPNTPAIDVAKNQDSPPGDRLNSYATDWEYFCLTRQKWEIVKRRVKETTGHDVEKLLDQDPSAAVEAIRYTARNYDQEQHKRDTRHTECKLCGSEIDLLMGSYHRVNKRVVCPSHTVGQLAEHDII